MLASLTNRVNTFLLVLLVLMAAAIIAILASRASAGPLDPPGPPASTLPQVEPRMPIPPVGWDGTFPITISEPGSYFLTQNLTDTTDNTDGIDITANRVVLDLNGFTLDGAGFDNFDGVSAQNLRSDVTVRNGNVTGWHYAGIRVDSRTSAVEDVTADSNGTGIIVGSGSTVRTVVAEFNQGTGIQIDPTQVKVSLGGVTEDSIASLNGGSGIYLRAQDVTVRNCVIEGNDASGVQVGDAVDDFALGSFDVVEDNNISGEP